MKAHCAACDRPLGLGLSRCPYCGSPLREPAWFHGARFALLGLILLSLAWAAPRHPSAVLLLRERLRALLQHPPSALLLAAAVTLTGLPLALPVCIPGAATADTRRQTLMRAGHILFYGLALAVCAVLLVHSRPSAGAALPAAVALLVYPRLMRVPAYPLLAVPAIALAWALCAG